MISLDQLIFSSWLFNDPINQNKDNLRLGHVSVSGSYPTRITN